MTGTTDPVRLTAVVDGANTIGARPDGWWRDRPAAARRLHAELVRRCAAERGLRVVLVLEGAARAGVPPGSCGSVRTVHAQGSGDDEVVHQAAACDPDAALVVTADRGLRARLGLPVRGPGWVWDAALS